MPHRQRSAKPDVGGPDYLRQAERLFGEGLWDDKRTLHYLDAAIAAGDLTDFELAYASYMFGECKKDAGEYEPALALFERSLQLAPGAEFAIQARSSAGDICFAAGDLEGTIRHYGAALVINRDHAFAPDWLLCTASAIIDQETSPSREVVEEARAMLDEALAMLTGPDGREKYVTQFPYERALLQCRTARAMCMMKLKDRRALLAAVTEYREAEEHALAHLGPDIGTQDLAPLYEGWVSALLALDLRDEAKRVKEHAERLVG